jgi:hypothetical protein
MKRKLPPMLPRSESPSPVDEYDPDPCAKRQRCTTPGQMRSTKRKLPSPPQSPVEGLDSPGPDDPRLFKRQRCTTLERGLESLSLTAQAHALAPSSPTSTSAAQMQATPELFTRLPPSLAAPLVSAVPVRHQHEHRAPPEFAHSRWLEVSSSSLMTTVPKSRSISSHPMPISTSTSITYATSAPTLTSDTDATTDVKMHSSSWYEPEKDRTCPFSLPLFLFCWFAQSCSLTEKKTHPSFSSHVRFLVLYSRSSCNRNCHYRSGRVL